MKRKVLAWALLLCMLASLLPAYAFAESEIAEEPADVVILSDSEGSQTDESNEPLPEGEMPAEQPEGSEELSPAEGGTAPLAEEPEDTAVILSSERDEESRTVAEPEEEIFLAEQAETQDASIVASGTCGAEGDNLTWTLDDAGTLTISGEGAMKNYSLDSSPFFPAPWYNARTSILSVVIEYGITNIGDSSFYYCHNLSKLSIPESVLAIGNYAFLTVTDYQASLFQKA